MLAIFDTETSGFKGGVVELGSVILTDSGKRYTFHERCKPILPVEPGAYKTHGISDEDVANCRPQHDVLYNWVSDIVELSHEVQEEVVICAHNLQFDVRMIQQSVDLSQFKKVCSLEFARVALPDAEKHKLGFLYEYLGFTQAYNAHSALDDCLMLEQVLGKLMWFTSKSYYDVAREQVMPPKIIPKVTFGKHKGLKFEDVPRDYLSWIYDNHDNKDAVYTAGVILGKEHW